MDEHITTQTIPDGNANSAVSADGIVAGSENVVEVKDLLKEILGKEFPTNEAAIKSLKDTQSYVGQMGQKVKELETQLTEAQSQAVTPELVQTVKDLQTQLANANFYASNPEFNTPDAKSLIAKFGGTPEEVVKDEVFVKAFGALKTTAEKDSSQSVLHTNPRLGTVQDTSTQASEAMKNGNDQLAKDLATKAVMDAYGM